MDSGKEIADGQEMRKKGDFLGSMAQNLCATCEFEIGWHALVLTMRLGYTEGKGADFERNPGLDNERLGLPLEDLDQVCKEILA